MAITHELAPLLVGEPAEGAPASMSEAEFERLYAATAGPILGYLLAVTAHREVADDLLQETYCRFLSKRRAGKAKEMNADETRRYLFRIASNLLQDRWRSREERVCAEAPEAVADTNFDTAIDIRAMLLHLKPKERELLWLAYAEGMDHAEISAATGLGRLSVRTLLFRARNKARRFLRPEGEVS